MTKRLAFRLFLSVVLLASGAVVAEEAPEFAGHWHYAPTRAVSAVGDLAIFGSGTSLIAADVSDMASPVELGEIALGGIVWDITIVGDHAYVATGEAGLSVVNISDPTSLELVGTAGAGIARFVAHSGDLVFAAGKSYGSGSTWLHVIDASTPSSAERIGWLQIPWSNPHDLAADGSLVAVATRTDGLHLVDVSDPSTPTIVGQAPMDLPFGVELDGDLAIVTDQSGLHVLDLSDPASLVTIGFLDLGDLVFGKISHSDGLVALGGLSLVSIEDPANPVMVGALPEAVPADDVELIGDRVYFADWWPGGMYVADIGEPSQPVVLGSIKTAGANVQAEVVDSLAYLTTQFAFQILDISNPTEPQWIGSYEWEFESGGTAGGFDLDGNHAYLARGGVLEVIDISNPTQPVVRATVDLETAGECRAGSVIVLDEVVNVACTSVSYSTVQRYSIDVSDPTNPEIVGVFEWSLGVEMAVSDDVGYSVGGSDIWIIDVSDPANMVRVTSRYVPDSTSVAVSDDLLFVGGRWHPQTGQSGGLYIFDISDPWAPVQLVFWDWVEPQSVAVESGYAYLADGYNGLVVVDVSDPMAPNLVGSFHMPEITQDVAVGSGLVVATHGEAGTTIHYQIGGPLFADGFESGDTAAWSATTS